MNNYVGRVGEVFEALDYLNRPIYGVRFEDDWWYCEEQYKRRTIYRVDFEGYGAWWIEHDWISLYTDIEVSAKDKRALDSFIEDW